MDLGELKVKEHVRASVEFDATEYVEGLAEEDKPLVLTIEEPLLSSVSDAEGKILKVRIDFPLLDQVTAYHVALFAALHKSPETTTDRARAFYGRLAMGNGPAFALLRARFYGAFTWLRDIMAQANEKKVD